MNLWRICSDTRRHQSIDDPGNQKLLVTGSTVTVSALACRTLPKSWLMFSLCLTFREIKCNVVFVCFSFTYPRSVISLRQFLLISSRSLVPIHFSLTCFFLFEWVDNFDPLMRNGINCWDKNLKGNKFEDSLEGIEIRFIRR